MARHLASQNPVGARLNCNHLIWTKTKSRHVVKRDGFCEMLLDDRTTQLY